MKRLAVALSIAAALALAPAAAEASTGHTCPTHCTPAPTPPPGGWKCQQTHTCRPPKHPHCKPPKKHPKAPVTPPHSRPIPPVKTAPKPVVKAPKPVVHTVAHTRTVAAVTPTTVPKELAYTGFDTRDYLLVTGGLLGSGCLLTLVGLSRTPTKQRKAWKR